MKEGLNTKVHFNDKPTQGFLTKKGQKWYFKKSMWSYFMNFAHNCKSMSFSTYHIFTSFTIVFEAKNRVLLNTLRPRQNCHHFADDIFKCIFLNENVWISLKISLKFVPIVQINNIPALDLITAWRRPGDKPLSEPMIGCLLTQICVTRLQWVNNRIYV